MALCASLKAAREKKGITLDAIAASTKISRALLKGLEESDVSRWPPGLYRRSYLRDYLRAIDLAPESVLTEFAVLFPDEGAQLVTSLVTSPALHEPDESPMSIMLDEDEANWFTKARTRLAAVMIDLIVVLIVSGAAWWVLQTDVWASATIVAACYYSLGTATMGCSLGSRCLDNRSWRRSRQSASPAERPGSLFARLRQIQDLSKSAEDSIPEHIAGVPAEGAFFPTQFLP